MDINTNLVTDSYHPYIWKRGQKGVTNKNLWTYFLFSLNGSNLVIRSEEDKERIKEQLIKKYPVQDTFLAYVEKFSLSEVLYVIDMNSDLYDTESFLEQIDTVFKSSIQIAREKKQWYQKQVERLGGL